MKYPLSNNPEKRWELLKEYMDCGYIDVDTHLLKRYAETYKLSVSQRVSLAFMYSLCYNVPTTCLLYALMGDIKHWSRPWLEEIWETYKDKMIFQSNRKWVKIANQFVDLCMDFKENMYPYSEHIKPNVKSFDDMYKAFSSLNNQGRVATYTFIDGLIALGIMKPSMPDKFNWNNGHTCTEGMLHAIGRDDLADYFQMGKHKLSPDIIELLDQSLDQLVEELREAGVEEYKICDYETRLCAYRKFFKGTRYHGYYIDRLQSELLKMQSNLPDYNLLWETLTQLRKDVYPPNLLGEINGWTGIRKDKAKEFLETGVMRFDS